MLSFFLTYTKYITPSERHISTSLTMLVLAFAALLLIIPGFITDIFGFLLIIPITRRFFINKISVKFKKEKTNTDFIEGEITEEKKYKENGKDS